MSEMLWQSLNNNKKSFSIEKKCVVLHQILHLLYMHWLQSSDSPKLIKLWKEKESRKVAEKWRSWLDDLTGVVPSTELATWRVMKQKQRHCVNFSTDDVIQFWSIANLQCSIWIKKNEGTKIKFQTTVTIFLFTFE